MSKSNRKTSQSQKIRFIRPAIKTSPPEPILIHAKENDVLLNRLSKLAQIATPILAVFGFWYTVLPLYSKAVLEEQVAQTQLELNHQKNELFTLESSIATKQHKVEELTRYIAIEEERSSALQEEINDLSKQRAAAEDTALKASIESNRLYQEMRASVLTAALNDAALCFTSVFSWGNFYMAETKWITDSPSAFIGARYEGIDGIAECIPKKIMHTFGISQLSSADAERLNAILTKHNPELISDLKEVDLLLSNQYDAYLSAVIILEEYKLREKEKSQFSSREDAFEQLTRSFQASTDFNVEHINQIQSLQSDGMAKLSAYIDRVRSELIALKWIEQPKVNFLLE